MSKENIIVGLDIGSSNVRTVIVQYFGDNDSLRVVGVGEALSAGIRRGSIVDIEEAGRSINASLEMAEKMCDVTVDRAVIGIGGSGITIHGSKGVVAIGRADGEVVEDDIERVINAAQAISVPPNREIIHVIPKNYRLDDQENIKDPVGMNGVRLEVDSMIIEGPAPHIKSINKCIYQSGIEIDDLVLSSLAASTAVLSKKQKELGVVLVDIGGGTTSMAVYEEGDIVHASILPVGSGHITNDIAIGLRSSIEVAEKIKLEFGLASTDSIDKKEEIDLSLIDSSESGMISRYHVAEIIEARLEEIFSLVDGELKKIGRAGLLPAGVILVGGGSEIHGILDVAKKNLRLPAQIGYPEKLSGILDKVDKPSFATAIGLVLWAKENVLSGGKGFNSRVMDGFSKNAGATVGKVKKWMEKLLP